MGDSNDVPGDGNQIAGMDSELLFWDRGTVRDGMDTVQRDVRPVSVATDDVDSLFVERPRVRP